MVFIIVSLCGYTLIYLINSPSTITPYACICLNVSIDSIPFSRIARLEKMQFFFSFLVFDIYFQTALRKVVPTNAPVFISSCSLLLTLDIALLLNLCLSNNKKVLHFNLHSFVYC